MENYPEIGTVYRADNHYHCCGHELIMGEEDFNKENADFVENDKRC
jgi:hypothetical protein